MRILITGFDPFGGEKTNPSIEAVMKISEYIENVDIKKLQIPTVFHKSSDVLEDAIIGFNPDAILCVGQAGGRNDISVERVAINQDDARIKDNEGNQPIDLPIRKDGKNAYFSTLPIKRIVEEIKKENIPASVSNSAGTFVCNHIMYQALYLGEKYGIKKVGFIHVPFLPEQVINRPNTSSMSLDNIIKGLNIAVKTIVNFDTDMKISGGIIA